MFDRLRYKFMQFMQGRYGVDQLNRFLSLACLVLIVAQLFLPVRILWWLALACLALMYFRMFSRNIAKRYRENQQWMEFTSKLRTFFTDFRYNITHLKENHERNKDFHIYKCPRCSQKIRIPKGKGHIMVRCPRCGFEFHKKS